MHHEYEAAIFGLVGTVIGATLSWLKDWLFERKRRTGHASYLAVRVICILDRFVSDCYDFVCNGRSDDGSLPKFAGFPDDIDWKAISPDLMYQILRFPNEILSANDSIQFITDVVAAPPDYEEIIEERQYQYALLGLTALSLASKLRGKYAIPRRDYSRWNPEEEFRKTKDEIEASRKPDAKIRYNYRFRMLRF